jgi:hypothetical protein
MSRRKIVEHISQDGVFGLPAQCAGESDRGPPQRGDDVRLHPPSGKSRFGTLTLNGALLTVGRATDA